QKQDLKQRQPDRDQGGRIDFGQRATGGPLDQPVEGPPLAQHAVDERGRKMALALVSSADLRQERVAASAPKFHALEDGQGGGAAAIRRKAPGQRSHPHGSSARW